MPAATRTRTRHSAGERRTALVEAAHRHFAHGGLHGTAVSEITRDVGITQPYAFSLFGTKKELFLAACTHNVERVLIAFRGAVGEVTPDATPDDRMKAMGTAYAELLADREVLLMQLQSQAACGDPEVRTHVRAGYARLRDEIEALAGEVEPARLARFVATGMFMNLAVAVDAPEWAEALMDDVC
jgi:AcrR family transcriptional regulator